LRQARAELTNSLAVTTSQLKAEFENLHQKTAQSLDTICDRVDARLLAITDQCSRNSIRTSRKASRSLKSCSWT
jgi:hypothetical protein